jgi:hypothetical protein
MSKVRAVLDRIEAEQRQARGVTDIPDDVSIQELAEQQRMLIELLPFYMPKLSAVGVGYFTHDTFAERLDRAIRASERVMIEAKAIEVEDHE